MFESKKTRGVDSREVRFCHLCGVEVVQLNFANGHPYLTDVRLSRDGARFIILGEGAHYNFKPAHNCLKEAEIAMERAERDYQEFVTKHEAARQAVVGMDQSDASMAEHGYMEKMEVDDAARLRATFKSLRTNVEANLKTLEGQKQGWDEQIAHMRDKVKLLRAGKSTVPSGHPVVGRFAKVIKGRKVPVGTQGRIFFVGLSSFNDSTTRVGIQTGDGQKHYTNAENVEVIQLVTA
jgi:hypothetical protein